MTVAPPFGNSGSEDFDFCFFVFRGIAKVFLNHGVGVRTTCESQCGQFQTLPISCGKNSYFPPHDQHLLFSYSIGIDGQKSNLIRFRLVEDSALA